MSTGADVRSLAQLQHLRERCTLCRVQALKEAEALVAELQRLTRWLDAEAAPYWEQQGVLAARQLKECQEALLRCQATVRADEKRPCTDERKRLERAAARRALCEQRIRLLRDARNAWQKQVVKLRGRLQATADLAENQLLATIHKLDTIIATLAAYAQVQSSPAALSIDPLRNNALADDASRDARSREATSADSASLDKPASDTTKPNNAG